MLNELCKLCFRDSLDNLVSVGTKELRLVKAEDSCLIIVFGCAVPQIIRSGFSLVFSGNPRKLRTPRSDWTKGS